MICTRDKTNLHVVANKNNIILIKLLSASEVASKASRTFDYLYSESDTQDLFSGGSIPPPPETQH